MFKSIVGILAAVTLSSTALLAQASSYYYVSDYVAFPEKIKLGDKDQYYKPSHKMMFHLPDDYDYSKNVVLQMRIRSVNKSKYNAMYMNPDYPPYPDGDYCGSKDNDANEHQRVDYLPYAVHQVDTQYGDWSNVWTMYHKVIPGDWLKSGANELLLCARDSDGSTSYNLDDFYVRDIVIHYRIRKGADEEYAPE